MGPHCFLWSLAGLERLFSKSTIFLGRVSVFLHPLATDVRLWLGPFFFFSLFTSLGISSFFSSNSRIYEAEMKSKELTTCYSLGPKVSDLLSFLHLLESSCGCYPYMLVYILLSIYVLCMSYVYIYLHTHTTHSVQGFHCIYGKRIGKSPFTSCLQEKSVSALTFTSVLDRTAECEVSKRDCRICTHFHTETLLIVIEPCPPIKQAICLAALTWNIGRACLCPCENTKETKQTLSSVIFQSIWDKKSSCTK